MVGLDTKIAAKDPREDTFALVEEGVYGVTVNAIDAWLPITKDVNVYIRDEAGYPVRDDNGKLKTQLVKNLTFYTAKVTFKINDGKHKGRLLSTQLTTHPNALFITEGFLYAVGVSELAFSEIQKKCVGKVLDVEVKHKTLPKRSKINATTGLPEDLPERVVPEVKTFLRQEIETETY